MVYWFKRQKISVLQGRLNVLWEVIESLKISRKCKGKEEMQGYFWPLIAFIKYLESQ